MKKAFIETASCSDFSQSYSFSIKKPFAKTVLVEFAKWYFEAQRVLKWKRKYIQFKTAKKFSEKLLCFLWIHHTELQFSLKKPFAKTVFAEFAKWYLEVHRGLWWKRKYPEIKTEKMISEKLLWDLLIHLTEFSFTLKKPFDKTVFVEFAKWYLEAHRGLWWKRKYLPFKTGKKLSEKLLCVLLIHLTELHLSLQEAFR